MQPMELMHRLISISFDKISNETEGGCSNRKNHEIDLRKALLVAHFIEQIQNVPTNINEQRSNECKHAALMKELQSSQLRGSDYDVEQTASSSPSATVLQCVNNNSENQTSKYCQYTMPVVCSVNTHQVMSNTPYISKSDATSVHEPEVVIEAPEVIIDENGDMVASDDLEISSCCEVVTTTSSSTDDESSSDEESPHDDVVLTSSPLKRRPSSSSSSTNGPPLPKKKRPLPKEFLSPTTTTESSYTDSIYDDEDSPRIILDSSIEDDDDDEEEEDLKQRRSSLEGYNSTITTSAVRSFTSTSTVSTSTASRPKVLVQVTDSARYAKLHSWNRLYYQQQQS